MMGVQGQQYPTAYENGKRLPRSTTLEGDRDRTFSVER